MTTPGGPLLTVADMLLDLSSSEDVTLGGASSSPSLVGTSSCIQEPGLSEFLRGTYSRLNEALKESGHTWTGLTQELCSTFTTADRFVATAHANLGQLSVEVTRLEEIVKSGQDAIVNLQARLLATDQHKGENLPVVLS